MRVTVQLCRFKRRSDTPWENGLMLNEDQAIVDEAGRIVPAPIWSFHNCTGLGLAIFDGDPAGEANKSRKLGVPGAT